MRHRSTPVLPLFLAVQCTLIFLLGNPLTAGAQADQTLGLKLVGTLVTDEPGMSLAIIEITSTRNQGVLREGDRWNEIVIKKVLPLSVVVDTGKGEVVLSLSSGAAGAQPPASPQMAHLERKEVDSTLPDYNRLIQQIRVRPRFEGGHPTGFVIYSVEPGSIFSRMGLKDGDIIVGTNGRPFATTQPVVEFYDALKESKTVYLEIRRGDRKQELRFEIQ